MQGCGRGASPAPLARGRGIRWRAARAIRAAVPVLACLCCAYPSKGMGVGSPSTGAYSAHSTATTATRAQAEAAAVLPRTCLEWMLSGLSQDGFYEIDPDGPGGFASFQAFCKLNHTYSSPGTTVIRTTPSAWGAVFPPHQQVSVQYQGVPDIGAISPLIEASAGCSQFLKYTCNGLPVWSADGVQQVAWLDRNGQEMPNWGGASAGQQGCACSFSSSGCSGGGICNCDSPGESAVDAGQIADADSLPVTGLVFRYADAQTAPAPDTLVGRYHVGGLRCFGEAQEGSGEVTTERALSTPVDGAITAQPPTDVAGVTTVEGSTSGAPTDAQTTAQRSSTIADASTTNESPSTVVPATSEEAATASDQTTAGDETNPGHIPTGEHTTAAPKSTAAGLMTSGTTPTVKTEQPSEKTTAANLVYEIEASLQNQLDRFAISAGNTSTDTLINATKNILGMTSSFFSDQDSLDTSTKMSVVSLLESSLSMVALGLRDGEALQLNLGKTKVEATSFSSAESLQGYVFSAAGADSPKDDDGESKDTRSERGQEVTLRTSTGSFAHVEGSVKVLVVYRGLANGTGEKAAGEETSSGSWSDAVNSGILSCSVLSGGQSLDVGLEFSLQHKMDTAVGFEDKIVLQQCSFWDTTLGNWSTKGCRTVETLKTTAGTKTSCFCGHNTSFAVLLQVTERPIGQTQVSGKEYALDLLSTILGTISVICLALTLILYTYLRLFRFLQIKVHANLVAALLVGQLLFLTGIDATENWIVCRIVTVLLQLFFSSAFGWMLIEGGLLFQRATMVSKQPPKILYLMLIGWGIPALLTLISFSVGYHQYGTQGSCWLSVHRGQIWAFLTLVIVVVLVNVIVMGVVLKTFLSLKMNKDKDNADRIRASFRAVVILMPILGLPWVFGFLGETSPVFQYLFVIFNSSQGTFVFICHGVLNIEVQKAMKRRRSHKVSSLGISLSAPSQSQSGAKKTMTTTASGELDKEGGPM